MEVRGKVEDMEGRGKVEDMEVRGKVEASAEGERCSTSPKWDALTGFQLLTEEARGVGLGGTLR
ncbi:hypothetical protein CYMTET_27785 [Cymbomonas tetramitiformis]|uniref:Uncharacterized protein n=1 Tax=Cymbomonas tetramitiformis TaxID=36881 RepID=A0AAE0KWK1_9CHLO|nr:hypothetical protein CYMTET_27785 [Cymbomonas tetramitiformis]